MRIGTMSNESLCLFRRLPQYNKNDKALKHFAELDHTKTEVLYLQKKLAYILVQSFMYLHIKFYQYAAVA
jgi:hypothetical protein